MTIYFSKALVLLCFVTALSVSAAQNVSIMGGEAPPKAFLHMQHKYLKSIEQTLTGRNCTDDNIAVRRSWGALTSTQRMEYIEAVKCLHSLPTAGDPDRSPGNQNRIDDFVYSHINQTFFIHNNGHFLPWHRYFVWAYEKALREECGYTGYQPYWDAGRHSQDQFRSPLFDGSKTSIGGDGEFKDVSRTIVMPGLPEGEEFTFTVPPGTGGGCVLRGPFAQNYNVSLGPVTPGTPPTPGDTFGLQYNPRCLKRNFYMPASQNGLTWRKYINLLSAETIDEFRPLFESMEGMHASLHLTTGGISFDFFASPSDPAFFFIHNEVDRIWAIWQGQDFENRRDALNGTRTFFNIPPSEEATLEDDMDFAYAASGPIVVRDVMSTTSGPFCYRYE